MPTLFWWLAYLHITFQQDSFRNEVLRYVSSTGSPSDSTKFEVDFPKLLSSGLLNSGLKETLRVQAHNLTPRDVIEDTFIKIEGKEYLLKKGSLAFAPSTLVNWNPDIYDQPTTWRGDRFVDKAASDEFTAVNERETKIDRKRLKFPLVIWGGGPHMVAPLGSQLTVSVPADALQLMRF